MEYTVVSKTSSFDLIEAVNELIRKGWTPLGGIAVDYEGPDKWYQAMKKES
jgi:hypothetical protein